jgi:hypothetical protein
MGHAFGIDICVIFFLWSDFLLRFRPEGHDVWGAHATVKRTRVCCGDKFIFWPSVRCGRIDKVGLQVSLSSPLSFTDIPHIDICLFVCVPSIYISSLRRRSNILTNCDRGYRTLIIDINIPQYIICVFQRFRIVGVIKFNWLLRTDTNYSLVWFVVALSSWGKILYWYDVLWFYIDITLSEISITTSLKPLRVTTGNAA